MSKGSRRRPEDAAAIERNWPLEREIPCPICREPMSYAAASERGWVACWDHRKDYDPEALRK